MRFPVTDQRKHRFWVLVVTLLALRFFFSCIRKPTKSHLGVQEENYGCVDSKKLHSDFIFGREKTFI